MKHLKSLNKFLWKYRQLLFLGIVFIFLSNLFGIYSPVVVKSAIDSVVQLASGKPMINTWFSGWTGNSLSASLIYFGILILVLALARGVFLFLMRQTIIVMSRKIEYDQKNQMFNHYLKLDLNFYKMNSTGDLMSRITEDISRVRMYTGPAIMYVLNTSILFVMVVWAMLKVSPLLTCYALMPLPVLGISIFYVNSIIEKKSEAIQQQLSSLTAFSQESFSGIRVIKSYVQEKLFGNLFEKECNDYKVKQMQLAKLEAIYFPIIFMLVGLSTLFTVFVGGIQVIEGKITAGTIAEFVIYINMLTWPIASVGWITAMMQRAAASQKRLNEFLDVEPAVHTTKNLSFNFKGNIEFNDVWFSYPHSGIAATRGLSFKICAGEKVLILGKTGSGKSTIGQLILRLYDIDQGSLLIDGMDIRSLNPHELRKQIGYVPQDVFLFSDTVSANIAFGSDVISQTEIENAATYAAVNDEIKKLPHQFETIIGERGITLSGGQKQRISIARALIKNPQCIILDDCLSAVDAATEQKISLHLSNQLKDKTGIIITHRIPQTMNFNHILVIDDGKIIESGTHDLLMKLKGYYANIWEKQLRETISEPAD